MLIINRYNNKINNHDRFLIIQMKIGCKKNELKYESAVDGSDLIITDVI